MRRLLLSFAFLIGSAAFAGQPHHLRIDPTQVTVSGVSAGGQMAHQLHIAYPDLFSGVGIIAGGPFGCAGGSLATAMTRCMGSVKGALPLAQFVSEINMAVGDGKLGETATLADDHVWVFHGTLDNVVAGELSDTIVALYGEFMPVKNIRYVNEIGAAHHFPTRDQGSECTVSEAPFIGDCDYDAAGELLNHLYGELEAPLTEPTAELTKTLLAGAAEAGLAETAYLFVPTACRQTEKLCKAHFVLHGCAQSTVQVDSVFIEQSGYLRWAEANDIVLAFPQVAPAANNPFACWDWWGYTGEDYRWRTGAQMEVLTNWLRRLTAP